MYNKTTHSLISRINPRINPTLKIGHSCLVENGDSLQFQHDIELDESLSSYTCTFTVSSDELVVDVAGEINKLVTVAGAVFIPTPSGFRNIGTAMGIQLGVGVGDFTHLSDSSCFWMEENGFAVKTNVLYPMKIDKSGYAGLVGTADKYFPKGLISRRGSIDIEAWNYLDTLIDFGGSAGVLSAGIIINQFDGTDCNDDLITTAETKLDPAEIAILVPASGDDIELNKNFTVSGTSNCANVKIEASADGTTWVVLSASVAVSGGAFSKTNCQLPSTDFEPNDEITIRVSDVDAISLPDTVVIDTLSTITITPAIGNQTAGVAFNVAGTTNLPDGAEVEVFADATSKGTASVASGAFTKSVTIADPATGVVMKVDDVLNSNAYDTETINVASGVVTPVDVLYDSFDYTVFENVSWNIGDCCNSASDSDEIVLQRADSVSNDLRIDRIDVVAKTANTNITANPAGSSLSSSRYGTAEIDNTYIVGIFYDGLATRRIKYNVTDTVNYNATGGEFLVGCCNIGGTVHFLMNDAKLYSSSYPFTDFTLVKDLSAILPASNGFKPCTYNPDDGYLYVLDRTNKKLYTIDLATGTKVSDITMTDATNGIVWHKTSGVGRIHYCYYYSPSTGQYRIKVNILKNSDDA